MSWWDHFSGLVLSTEFQIWWLRATVVVLLFINLASLLILKRMIKAVEALTTMIYRVPPKQSAREVDGHP